jgi:large subunit ribosomal protein L25
MKKSTKFGLLFVPAIFCCAVFSSSQLPLREYLSPKILVMQQFKLNIETRENTGRGVARRLRASGKIPASLYGQGKARSITVTAVDFRDLNRDLAGGTAIVELTDEKGETALSLVQSVQRDAIKGSVDHIDFQEVERGHSFNTHVSVHLVGEADCIGVKRDGGVIDHKTHQIDIRCRPSNLPEHVEVDVSNLAVGDAIHIRDLAALEGVEFLGEPAQVLVSCQPPTVATAAEEEAEAEAAAVAADEVPASKVKADDESDADEK